MTEDEELDRLGETLVNCVNGHMPNMATIALAITIVLVVKEGTNDLHSALEEIDKVAAGMRSDLIERFEERGTLQ